MDCLQKKIKNKNAKYLISSFKKMMFILSKKKKKKMMFELN